MNPRSVADFLALSYVPDPLTIYHGVEKLLPGHSLTVTEAGLRQRRYWQPVFAADPSKRRFEDVVDEIRAIAADAVERRMVSDVPLGAFLSGGVDSSAVVGLMAQRAPDRVKTFSIGFTVNEFDELAFARLAAERWQTEHREDVVPLDIGDTLQELVAQFDEPFGDSSAIPMLYLARLARREVTVALSGDGADELFGGYRRYFHEVVDERMRRRFPERFRRTVLRRWGENYPAFEYLPKLFQAGPLLKNLASEIGDTYFTTMTAFRNENIMAPEMRRALGSYTSRASFRERFAAYRHLSPLQQLQAVDLETYLPGDILVKVDRTTMAHSLESRSPWLDYRLGELACSLPESYKLRGEIGKHVFKQAMAPYLPPEIVTRFKMGFSAPVADWFRGALKRTFEEQVFSPSMGAYLAPGEVRRIWDEHQAHQQDHARRLWTLLMLATWVNRP